MRYIDGQTNMNKVCKWLGVDDLDLEDTDFHVLRKEFKQPEPVAKETSVTCIMQNNEKLTIPTGATLDSILTLVI